MHNIYYIPFVFQFLLFNEIVGGTSLEWSELAFQSINSLSQDMR